MAHELGTHTAVFCQDIPAHVAAAEEKQIQKCLENRQNQWNDLIAAREPADLRQWQDIYCVSAYCPRCQELRQFHSVPVIEPNAWLHEADMVAEQRAAEQALRNQVAEIVCNLQTARFAPNYAPPEGESTFAADLDSLLGLAESIRVSLLKDLEDHVGNEDVVVDSYKHASQLLYRNDAHIKSSFLTISRAWIHYTLGVIRFTNINEENAGGF